MSARKLDAETKESLRLLDLIVRDAKASALRSLRQLTVYSAAGVVEADPDYQRGWVKWAEVRALFEGDAK